MPPLKDEDKPNLFRNTAWLYDVDVSNLARHDISFYRTRARRARDGLLELACGTGRVTIPLARDGFGIWGLDLSAQMLEVCREKLRREPYAVSERVRLVRADMADFALDRTFDLIIVPFRGFQALTDDETIWRALNCIRRHLTSGGTAVIDVFEPGDLGTRPWRGEDVDWVRRLPDTGQTITRTRRRKRLDTRGQILYSDIVYYIREPDGAERVLTDNLALKYYYRHQLEWRLAAGGFTIEEELGYYDGRPMGRGSEMIFVFRKSD